MILENCFQFSRICHFSVGMHAQSCKHEWHSPRCWHVHAYLLGNKKSPASLQSVIYMLRLCYSLSDWHHQNMSSADCSYIPRAPKVLRVGVEGSPLQRKIHSVLFSSQESVGRPPPGKSLEIEVQAIIIILATFCSKFLETFAILMSVSVLLSDQKSNINHDATK